MNTREMIEEFMNLSKNAEIELELREKIAKFLKNFSKNDIRKKSTKLRLWKFLENLRSHDSIKDPIDGIMADLADKWGKTLGKALREQKIS